MEENIVILEGIISENTITEENKLEEIKIDIESCPICLEEIVDPCKTECEHIICKKCIEEWFKKKKDTCPLCRNIIESYHENDERVKVIKIEDIPTISDEETERYTLFLKTLIGKIRFFKYSCYGLLLTNLYLYFKYSNTYYTMYEYKDLFEICNTSTTQGDIKVDDNNISLSEILIVVGSHLRRCMIPDKYISKCFA